VVNPLQSEILGGCLRACTVFGRLGFTWLTLLGAMSLLAEIVDFSCGTTQVPHLGVRYHIFSDVSLNIYGMVDAPE